MVMFSSLSSSWIEAVRLGCEINTRLEASVIFRVSAMAMAYLSCCRVIDKTYRERAKNSILPISKM